MRALLLTAAVAVAGCSTVSDVTDTTTEAPAAPANALTAEWTGPYGGVPPFDRVRIADFEPGVRAAMAAHLAEIDAIAANPAAPTFDNTLAAMQRAGRALDRVGTVYGVWGSNYSTPEFQAVEAVVDPLFAAHSDQISQNAALFQRIEAVYNSRTASGLTPEQQRLTSETYTDFVRGGARLDAAAKVRMSAINQELSGLYTGFSQHVLADETDLSLVLDSRDDLAGLSEGQIAAYAAEAERRGMPGKWVVANTRSSIDPFLAASERRDLRERAWRLFASRGDNGDANDNNAAITRILALRAERASLLGYETFAHYRLDNSMAKTPERALALMEAVWTPAVARVREEVADMQAVADREGAGITIEPWDYRFYAEKVRAERYDLDPESVRPYLQLENLREGMFWVAGELFGFAFAPAADVPVPHPDVRVWTVTNRATGAPVGLWYFDPYARPGKRSGAWMIGVPQPGAHGRAGDDHRLEQLQLYEARARRARPDLVGRRRDALPRVRPRAPRPQLERDLPRPLGHERRPRLRRVPLAAARALALDARGAPALRASTPRPASRSRSRRSRSSARRARSTRASGRSSSSPRPSSTCARTSPARRRSTRTRSSARRSRPTACRARSGCATGCRSSCTSSPRRLRGGLLQLPLGRRHHGRRLRGVHRGGRAVRPGRRRSACATMSSRSATRSTRPRATAPSAATTRPSGR